jgi:hypothetical protein
MDARKWAFDMLNEQGYTIPKLSSELIAYCQLAAKIEQLAWQRYRLTGDEEMTTDIILDGKDFYLTICEWICESKIKHWVPEYLL